MKLLNHAGESKWGLFGLMNFVNYTVYNTSGAEFTNVNAGGTDIAAGASNTAVALSDAELAAVCVLNGAVVMQTGATAAEIRAAAKALVTASDLDSNVAEIERAESTGITLHREAAWAAYEAT